VVEQTDVLLNKDNAQFLSRLENGHVILAADGGSDILDT
jgi:hypothetical protein